MCVSFSTLSILLSLSNSSHVGTWELIHFLPWRESGSNQLSWFLFKSLFFSACNGGESHHMAKCWAHLWCAKRTFIVSSFAKIFITDYLISSQEQWAHSKEDEPNGSIVIAKFEAQWAHLWCAPLFWFGIRLIQIWSVSLEGYTLCGRAQVLVGLL